MIEFGLGQFTCSLDAFVLAHRRLYPSQASVVAGARAHWLRTSRRGVKRFTGVRLFVMAITDRCDVEVLALGIGVSVVTVLNNTSPDMGEFVLGQFTRGLVHLLAGCSHVDRGDHDRSLLHFLSPQSQRCSCS